MAIFVATLYLSNGMFLMYGNACQYIGLLFLVVQAIILIDLFYLWGIRWARSYDEHSPGCYGTLLIVFTIIMYGAAWLCNIYGYWRFYDCRSWVNVGTSTLLIALPLVQMLNLNQQNSLLATSAVCLYVAYLGLISQYSNVDCNAFTTNAMIWDMATSTFLFFLTMYGSVMGGTGISDNPMQQLPVVDNQQAISNEELKVEYTGASWITWHIYMAIGAMYIAMMVTNWGSPQMNHTITDAYRPNSFAFWSRLGLQWVTALLYVWTLVAPGVCPKRDFTVV